MFNALLIVILALELTTDTPVVGRAWEKFVALVHAEYPGAAKVLDRSVGWTSADADLRVPENPARRAQRPPPSSSFEIVPPVIDDAPPRPRGRVLRVGPGLDFAVPSAAAKAAQDGDTIEIAPGTYAGDVAIWRQDGLTIRGRGGMVWLDARDTKLPQRKAIWVIKGDDTLIENIAFLHARSPDRNGAGIRQEGAGLWVRNCYFFGNQSGILTGRNPASDIVIEHSEFAWNGHPGGQAHNVYIGNVNSLTFRFNYVHHALIGSNLKSRARINRILYNRIMDEADGRGNYNIDLSIGGRAFVIGNLLHQSRFTENYHLLTFAPEGARHDVQELYVINNTFVNDRDAARFIYNRSAGPAYVYNNLFSGAGDLSGGRALLAGNVVVRDGGWRGRVAAVLGEGETLGGVTGSRDNRVVDDAGFVDADSYDYRLLPSSPAVDAGRQLDAAAGVSLQPEYQYVHPRSGTRRPVIGPIDAGAYEYAPER